MNECDDIQLMLMMYNVQIFKAERAALSVVFCLLCSALPPLRALRLASRAALCTLRAFFAWIYMQRSMHESHFAVTASLLGL